MYCSHSELQRLKTSIAIFAELEGLNLVLKLFGSLYIHSFIVEIETLWLLLA